MHRRSSSAYLLLVAALTSAAALACGSSGLSKDDVKPLVALSLSGQTDLNLAAFTGTFCESDDGRRLRTRSTDPAALPSNAYAFGRMADNAFLKTLISSGYVTAHEEEQAPEVAEGTHPACGTREMCEGCPSITKYYVRTYELTPKGKDLFLVTPATEGEYISLYNTALRDGPFDDVQQELGDDMPMRISVVVATKAFDITRVTTDAAGKTARVDYEWYWKPSQQIDKTPLRQLVPQGHNRASVDLKQLDDGWHLARDAEPAAQ
jgi:hypothetical protein